MSKPSSPTWPLAVLLALATLAVYWPTTGHDFVSFDDYMYVTENPHVTGGLTLGNALWAFRTGYAANWHPLTWLSHMLDWQLFGAKPGWHHFTSVLLHALNAGLVFALLKQMTRAAWRSFLVAALFALHPLRVESVAWVAERKDVLSGLFFMLTLWAYAHYVERAESRKQKVEMGRPEEIRSPITEGTARAEGLSSAFDVGSSMFDVRPATLSYLPSSFFYLLSLLFFALGLMSKPMLVTVPFLLLLLDYWPLGRLALSTQHSKLKTAAPLVLEKLPFFALAALSSLVTFLVQQRGGAMTVAEYLPLGVRSGNALLSYGRYLGKLFWPVNLVPYYPHPGHLPAGKVLLTGGLILGLSALVWAQRRRYPYLLVGWLWFLGTLVPVIGLVQVGQQAMADRYTYLPSLGVAILAVWGACELIQGKAEDRGQRSEDSDTQDATRSTPTPQSPIANRQSPITKRQFPIANRKSQIANRKSQILQWAGCAAIVLCLVLARQQLASWKDSETLFRHMLVVNENDALAHNNLGVALGRKGQLDEAIRHCREAIRLQPGYAEAHNNLGIALDEKGQVGEAIVQYREAIRLKPDYADAYYNLGTVLLLNGQLDEAIRQFQSALRLNPYHAEAQSYLQQALRRKER